MIQYFSFFYLLCSIKCLCTLSASNILADREILLRSNESLSESKRILNQSFVSMFLVTTPTGSNVTSKTFVIIRNNRQARRLYFRLSERKAKEVSFRKLFIKRKKKYSNQTMVNKSNCYPRKIRIFRKTKSSGRLHARPGLTSNAVLQTASGNVKNLILSSLHGRKIILKKRTSSHQLARRAKLLLKRFATNRKYKVKGKHLLTFTRRSSRNALFMRRKILLRAGRNRRILSDIHLSIPEQPQQPGRQTLALVLFALVVVILPALGLTAKNRSSRVTWQQSSPNDKLHAKDEEMKNLLSKRKDVNDGMSDLSDVQRMDSQINYFSTDLNEAKEQAIPSCTWTPRHVPRLVATTTAPTSGRMVTRAMAAALIRECHSPLELFCDLPNSGRAP